MVTPVPLPVIVFPRFPDWLPLSQPVKVPSSNPASGKEAACAVLGKGTKRASRSRGIASADTRLKIEYDR